MDPSFWHQRWAKNEIGFHEPKANPLLVTHFNELALPKGRRVLVPLCWKTLDIAWLLSQGYRVAGAELSEVAITQLSADLGVEPQISPSGALKHSETLITGTNSPRPLREQHVAQYGPQVLVGPNRKTLEPALPDGEVERAPARPSPRN